MSTIPMRDLPHVDRAFRYEAADILDAAIRAGSGLRDLGGGVTSVTVPQRIRAEQLIAVGLAYLAGALADPGPGS